MTRHSTRYHLGVWIEAVEGMISDRVAPRRFAFASVGVESRTVG